jgi:hypothetical protein
MLEAVDVRWEAERFEKGGGLTLKEDKSPCAQDDRDCPEPAKRDFGTVRSRAGRPLAAGDGARVAGLVILGTQKGSRLIRLAVDIVLVG